MSVLPLDPSIQGPQHELHTVRLIRGIRRRIRHLQSLPEIASMSGELEELQLALNTVGGTKTIWNQELVDHVVAQNVKTALEVATPAVDASKGGFKIFG